VSTGPDPQDPGASEAEGFLSRWSRLKQEARHPAPPAEARTPAPEPPAAATPPAPPAKPAEAAPGPAPSGVEPADAGLPPIGSLGEDSDYAAFLGPRVSPELRRQALRRLFHLPRFNERDGLTDYWEDYTQFEPLGDIVPHEMRAMLEREARRLAAAAAEALEGDAPPVAGPAGEAAGSAPALAPERGGPDPLAGEAGRGGRDPGGEAT
jgi:hypothetical protein